MSKTPNPVERTCAKSRAGRSLSRYAAKLEWTMIRSVTCGCIGLALLGCTAMGVYDSDRRFIGVIERSQKISRAGEPAGILMAFGAIGGLLHHAASQPTPTNLYFVRVLSGETFTVQVDEEFSSGSCVEVIPSKSAVMDKSYMYGQARLVPSDKCPT